jgi:hypothetical protein
LGAPDAHTDEFDGGEEVGWVFVVAGCDTPKLFDAIEEALDVVALLVEPWREGEALLAVGSIGNIGPDVPGRGRLTDGVAVIAFVAQQGCPSGMAWISASAAQAS